MGMIKRMKDMKDMVNAAPGMVAQAQQMGAQLFDVVAERHARIGKEVVRVAALLCMPKGGLREQKERTYF